MGKGNCKEKIKKIFFALIYKIRIKKACISGEKHEFFNMALITYCITLAMVIGSLIMQFDSMDVGQKIDFYGCKDISKFLFIISTICQTLVPTTITFCGTILILQSQMRQDTNDRVWLFILIICLALAGTCQTAINNQITLIIISVLLFFLIPIAFNYSKKSFYSPNVVRQQGKSEKSDGKPVA